MTSAASVETNGTVTSNLELHTNLVHSKKIIEIIPVPYVDFVPSVVPFRRFCKPKNILDSLVVPYVEKMYERYQLHSIHRWGDWNSSSKCWWPTAHFHKRSNKYTT